MKKIVLSGLLFISTIIASHAQLYTPSNTIPGTSTDNLGVGTNNALAKLTVQASSVNSNGGIKLLGFTYPNDQNYWSDNQFAMMYNGVFKNLIDSNGVSYFNGGNVGIGTNIPSASLDINTPSVAGIETLLKLKVSDASEDYIKISNSTQASGQFIPSLYSYHATDNRQALYLVGEIGLNNDTGSEPIMVFDSRLNSSAITNRPLFAWDSYGNRKMTLTSDGKLGIGTASPKKLLDIQDSNSGAGESYIWIKKGIDANNVNREAGIILGAGAGDFGNTFKIAAMSSTGYFDAPKLNFKYTNPAGGGIIDLLTIDSFGKVGIGTTIPDSKLTVNGKIHATEVQVTQSVPADYVFEKYYLGESSLKPDYSLLTLSEVEKFTEANHHLPNVPSAKEIKENGLLLGEMSNVLLQKIEELTLYVIEQNKSIEGLKKQLKGQNAKIKKLETAKK